MARRARRPGPQQRRGQPRPDATLIETAPRGGGRRVRARDRLQRPVRVRRRRRGRAQRLPDALAVRPRRLRARPLRPRRLAPVLRPRHAPRAGVRGRRRRRRSRASCSPGSTVLQRLGRRGPRDLGAGAARSSPRCTSATRDGGPHELSAVGHAHLDTAWLWPLEESRRKAQRTFSTQVRLMDEYPEHVFCASQAQHYAWIRERRPGAVRPRSASASRAASGRRSAARGSSRTATCPRASRSPASSCTASASSSASSAGDARSSGSPTSSATPASCRSSCARRASTRFLTQKLSWNRFNRARAPHVHVAGDRRQRGAHPLPAGRHLQRRGDRRRAAPRRPRLPRPRPLARQPARLRPRRRRRRADPRDARAPAPRPRPARAAAHDAAPSGGVLRPPRGGRAASCGRSSASCTSSTTAARTRPRRRSSAATAAARRRCTTPSCSARSPRGSGARRTRAPSWPRRGACCSSPSSTTSCPGTSITEVNERARADLADVEARADALAAAASAALGGARRRSVVPVNTTPWPRRAVAQRPGGDARVA